MRPDYTTAVQADIFDTSSGFVAPSPQTWSPTQSPTAFDGDIERTIADYAQMKSLPEGTYVAKWETKDCINEYIFMVRVETKTTHHVEVAP